MRNRLPSELFHQEDTCAISVFLQQIEIEKVYISQTEPVWEIYFHSRETFFPELLEQAEKFLLQRLTRLDKVALYPVVRKEDFARQEVLSAVVACLTRHDTPMVRQCFMKMNFQVEEKESAFHLLSGSSWAVKHLEEKNAIVQLARRLLLEGLEDVRVHCRYDPGLEAAHCGPEIDTLLPKVVLKAAEPEKKERREESGKKEYRKKESAGSLRNYRGEIKKISELTEEENNVVIQGKVFDCQERTLKTGKILLSIHVTDGTSSVACKIIKKPEEIEKIREHIVLQGTCRIKGNLQYDTFARELVLLVSAVEKTDSPGRLDQSARKRVELHLHTNMSKSDAMNSITDYIKQAAAWGHSAIALTDHGVAQAYPEAFFAGQKHGVKIIYGLEAYMHRQQKEDMLKKGRKTYHFMILVKNQAGLKNLYHLISESQLNYFKKVPRIPFSLLETFREGLIYGSACEAGELITAILEGRSQEELEEIASFYDFLEIQPLDNNEFMIRNQIVNNRRDLEEINRKVLEIGKKLNIPVVATGDVHFLHPEDQIYRRIIQAGQGYADSANQPPLYYRTTEEMLDEFSYLGQEEAFRVVVENPSCIAEMIEEVRPIPDKLYPPEIPGADEDVRSRTMARARAWYGDPLPEIVAKRIEKELRSIIDNGYAVLYHISQKLVTKSNEDGYLVGSRGSVGSSLVATLIGITEVNPLAPHYRCSGCFYSEFFENQGIGCGADLPEKSCPQCGQVLIKDGFEIPFEVFLGFKGDKVPDIDLNFSGEYQPIAHKYVEELFGREHVFRAGTIATIAEKTAFGYVKNFLEENRLPYNSAELNRLIKGCTGVKRTTGQHPGGLIVVPKSKEASDFTPLQRPAEDPDSDTITTHFDFHSLHDYLVKLDILGHDDPTAIKMLEDLTGLDARSIPFDDPATMSLFSGVEALGVEAGELQSSVGTYGIPEFGTKFVRQMLEDTKPQTFSDLVRISGFSHGTDVWLNNAQELIRNKVCKVSEAISARDDIMTYLMTMDLEPSLAFKIMEDVRKGKGINSQYEEEMRKKNVPQWYIDSCNKIKYMFPKAHAVAYVMMAFRIAYFKLNYPLAFYATFFSVRAAEFDVEVISGGKERVLLEMQRIQELGNQASQKEIRLMTVLEVALEMYLRGFSLNKISMEKSTANRFLISGNSLIPPFSSLPGVGETAAQSIENERNRMPFSSVEDLRLRAKVSKTVIEKMLLHGCLEDLPETNQLSMFAL